MGRTLITATLKLESSSHDLNFISNSNSSSQKTHKYEAKAKYVMTELYSRPTCSC